MELPSGGFLPYGRNDKKSFPARAPRTTAEFSGPAQFLGWEDFFVSIAESHYTQSGESHNQVNHGSDKMQCLASEDKNFTYGLMKGALPLSCLSFTFIGIQ